MSHTQLAKFTLWEAMAVASTGAGAVEPIMDCRHLFCTNFTDTNAFIIYKASSVTGTADVKIELAISHDGVAFSSYDRSLVAATQAVATAEDWKSLAILIPAPYAKFKATGVNSNPADGLLTAYLFFQELY